MWRFHRWRRREDADSVGRQSGVRAFMSKLNNKFKGSFHSWQITCRPLSKIADLRYILATFCEQKNGVSIWGLWCGERQLIHLALPWSCAKWTFVDCLLNFQARLLLNGSVAKAWSTMDVRRGPGLITWIFIFVGFPGFVWMCHFHPPMDNTAPAS